MGFSSFNFLFCLLYPADLPLHNIDLLEHTPHWNKNKKNHDTNHRIYKLRFKKSI